MKLNEARKVLLDMSGGNIRTLEYMVTESRDSTSTQCRVYIDGFTFAIGDTWEEALTIMRRNIEAAKIENIDEELI